MMTVFNPGSDSPFQEFGVNVSLQDGNEEPYFSNNMKWPWIRISMSVPDPGVSYLTSSDPTVADLFFEGASYSAASATFLNNIRNGGSSLIITVLPPPSWLTAGVLTGEQAIVAFANLMASAVVWVSGFNVNVSYVEPIPSFDLTPRVSPDDTVTLIYKSRIALKFRGISSRLIGDRLGLFGWKKEVKTVNVTTSPPSVRYDSPNDAPGAGGPARTYGAYGANGTYGTSVSIRYLHLELN
jgi:hypothetical protein